jgi:hypothetical protein
MVTPNSSSIAMISSTLSKPMTIQAGERLPSADRSQSTHHTAGRHRDSAARLCSAFLVVLASGSQTTKYGGLWLSDTTSA